MNDSRNRREGRYVGQIGSKALRWRVTVRAPSATAALTALRLRVGPLRYFMLVRRQLAPCGLMTWSHFCELPETRFVAQTEGDGWRVSTIFLGLDHSFGRGAPQLFETAVAIDIVEVVGRCSTWDEAVALHAQTVAALRAGSLSPDQCSSFSPTAS